MHDPGGGLSNAAEAGHRKNSYELALIVNDTGLPDDGPQHQGHHDGGHNQCHADMRFGGGLFQPTRPGDHLSSWDAPSGLLSQVASPGLILGSLRIQNVMARLGPRGAAPIRTRKFMQQRELRSTFPDY